MKLFRIIWSEKEKATDGKGKLQNGKLNVIGFQTDYGDKHETLGVHTNEKGATEERKMFKLFLDTMEKVMARFPPSRKKQNKESKNSLPNSVACG